MRRPRLQFEKADKSADLSDIYDHNLDVFSESPGFDWTYEDIKQEVDSGWELYSVKHLEDIIAALFIREERNRLLTKNTALKMNFQGSGYSHKIKEFFEDTARRRRLSSIVHYCRIDDFRAYSLNEGHGYRKMGPPPDGDGQVVGWVKKLG